VIAEDLNAGVRRGPAGVVLRSFCVAFVGGERIDHEGAPGAMEVRDHMGSGHPRDGADTPDRADNDPDPPAHPRPAEHQERAYDELGSHDEIDSALGLKAVSQGAVFPLLFDTVMQIP
jgi:hypothetical protein